MKKFGKLMTVGALASALCSTLALGACTTPTEPEKPEDDPYANIVAYDEETAEIFKFEAEEAEIVAPVALKCDAMSYQGNGHVVKAVGGTALQHFMEQDPSGSGSAAYGASAYVSYMGAAKGDKIVFKIESKVACVANITFLGKSSLHMSAAEDPTQEMQHYSMWNKDATPIYINGEKQTFEDTFFQLKVFAKTVEIEGVRLKKGENVIEIVAEGANGATFSPKAPADMFGSITTNYAFPDLDYISIDASVDADNFTFKNQTFTNEINTNGYYTQMVCSWVDSMADPAAQN